MKSQRTLTKAPVALAREALHAGQEALPTYSSKYSRHDFTQPQLFAILVLRQFFKTDYRGMTQLLSDLKDLAAVLELRKIPHYSTLDYAQQRLVKKGILSDSSLRSLLELKCSA